ncbi:LysR family transcriptional regulator [Psychromonas sp. 14N.309.X.WAT.B.A12]|uniref:LysR family transcriptional regulator n=1 Tax=unclassified Psychromonas TaxID=2614957 RepID=UPI0025B1C883|nr:LysR family transcriptional regulator [Psychromonas sp. 14N.309.X.WAT.B.A12]MDN2662272.1 LysR family transcriptional regulator [Psychromonas sp. 14N.309.X.WAT.B.A12]
MLKISLEQWRMFHAVVEFGGFNQASQNVYKSQSSIHNAVSKIEESLGVKLFLIKGRKTVLTEAGRMILRRSDYLLEEAKKVEDIGLTLSKGIESHLKIAVDEVFPRTLLYQALEQVSEKFPLVQIELLESILSGANEMLDNDNVEIAISPNSLGAGVSEHLCEIKFGAVVNPDHPLNKIDRKLTLEDLKKCRQIVVRDSSTSSNKERASDGWLKANQRWTVSHMQSSIDMISKGLGFAWLPLSLIKDKLNDGTLIPLQLDGNSERTVPLYLTFKDFDALGPVAQHFIVTIKALCTAA